MFKIDNTKLAEVQSAAERGWRNSALLEADIQINKREDSNDPTVAAWRQYRMDLRNWPEHPKFPDKAFRPSI